MAEISRGYIKEGMKIEKSKDDIDFIRKQIREELSSIMNGYMSRMFKLLVKVGTMTVTMCYFNAKVVFILLKYHEDKMNYKEMLEDSKKSAAAYLGAKSELVDELSEKLLDN